MTNKEFLKSEPGFKVFWGISDRGAGVGVGFVVDGSDVDELAGGIDDEDVRGGFCFVETAYGAGGVEERCGGSGVHFL